jgi:YHS domain-containing protein/CBS domain-containing protein
MKVRDAVKRKGGKPQVIDASQTVAAAIRQMRDRRVRALIVTDNDRLVGVVDSARVFSRLDEIGGTALDEKIAELVTEEAVTVGPDVLLSDVEKLFQGRRVHHVVVVDGGTVDGILTPADVLRRLLDHVEFLSEHMRDYISTAGYTEPDDEQMKVADPVCGMVFGQRKAAAMIEYDGQAYYFCTEACRRQFEADPVQYSPATAK